jgi:hypothetical protein
MAKQRVLAQKVLTLYLFMQKNFPKTGASLIVCCHKTSISEMICKRLLGSVVNTQEHGEIAKVKTYILLLYLLMLFLFYEGQFKVQAVLLCIRNRNTKTFLLSSISIFRNEILTPIFLATWEVEVGGSPSQAKTQDPT